MLLRNPLVKNLVSIAKKCKPYFFVCGKQVGSWSIDSYIFVHAAVAKRTLSHLGMHGAVVRRTFVLWWMNPLAGIRVSIARNCSEMQILSSRNCSAHCDGRFNAHEMEPCMDTFSTTSFVHCQVNHTKLVNKVLAKSALLPPALIWPHVLKV